MPKKSTPLDFWKHVERRGDDECWPWTAATDEDGYGRVRYHQREWSAHRLAWMLSKQDPGRLHVCHSCDNPPCCNPAHLFLGTQKDNSQDMVNKGRHPRNKTHYLPTGDAHHGRRTPEVMARGEDNGAAELDSAQVTRIAELYLAGTSAHRLAKMFGRAKGTIQFIVNGTTWVHITGGRLVRDPMAKPSKLTESQVNELRNAYASGVKQSDLAKRFGIGQAQVSRIVNHKRRK